MRQDYSTFIVDDFVEEIEVKGKRVKLPGLIVDSGAMDKYGIVPLHVYLKFVVVIEEYARSLGDVS